MVWKNLARIAAAGAVAISRALARAVQEELNGNWLNFKYSIKNDAIKATKQAAKRAAETTQSARTSSSANHQSARREQQKVAGLDARLGISLHESMQILDVKPPLKEEEIKRRYEHLFEVNDKSKGGTIYLQAKVNFFIIFV